jgi:hypothetical protein
LLETNAQIVEWSALLIRDNKRINWSEAAQTTDQAGVTTVQLPVVLSETTLEVIAVRIQEGQVSNVVFSRVIQEDQATRVAIANLESGVVVSGKFSQASVQSQVENLQVGISAGRSSVADILTIVEPTGVSVQLVYCAYLATALVLLRQSEWRMPLGLLFTKSAPWLGGPQRAGLHWQFMLQRP